jgi:L-ascorbate metabolism protein UlaG (beta-lactamase superfamily)
MNPILETLLAVESGIGFCWLGNLSWLLRAEGKLIAFDLDLDRENRLSPSPIPTEELAQVLDALFITHEHGDHFAGPTAEILVEKSHCDFVLPANCVERGKSFGIDDNRMIIARPFEPMTVCGFPVEPKRALHGHTNFTVYRRANMDDCGYVLSMAGQTIYQPGDTVLLQEHMEDFGEVDILFVSPTLHNTHIDASKRLIEAIQPNHIFPQHFGTYQATDQNSYWTVGYPDELRAVLSEPLKDGFHKLDQGEVFVIQ